MKIQFLINWHEDLLAAIYDQLCGLSSLAQLDPQDVQTWNLQSKNDGLKAYWYCKNSKLAVDDFFAYFKSNPGVGGGGIASKLDSFLL